MDVQIGINITNEEILDPMATLKDVKQARQQLMNGLQEKEARFERLGAEIQADRRELAEYDSTIRILNKLGGSEELIERPLLMPKSGKEAMLAIIKRFGDDGLKASEIREKAKQNFGMAIAPNSASNYLWNLHQEHKIRRDGHLWFAAPTDVSGGSNTPSNMTEARVSARASEER